MEQSKKEFLPVLQGVKLSKTQNPTTAEDRERMKVIPYALAIGSIKYAMLCTRSIVYPTLILAREYNSDLGVDHWTAVKITLSGIRICFLVMEVIKWLLRCSARRSARTPWARRCCHSEEADPA